MSTTNEIYFTESAPSAFFRRSKQRPYTVNDEDREINDQEIMEKLQLILISMREESSKVTRYYEEKINKMESEFEEQNNLITLLEQENKLLRSHLNIYESKFGTLSELCLKNYQIIIKEAEHSTGKEKDKKEIEIENEITHQDKIYLNTNKNQKNNEFSKMSTHYKSSVKKSSFETEEQEKKHLNLNADQNETEEQIYENSSSCSNFYKKRLPFYHRRQSSLQEQQSKGLYQNQEVNVMPIIRGQKTQKTEISAEEYRKNSYIDFFTEENSVIESEGYSEEIEELGLESKGNGFYSEVEKEDVISVENYRNENTKKGINLARIVESIEDINSLQYFESFRTNSVLNKLTSIMEVTHIKEKNQDEEKENDDTQINQNKRFSDLTNPDYLNEDEDKVNEGNFSSVTHKREKICGEKRLRALFSPFSESFLSKKVEIPCLKIESNEFNKNHIDNQVLNMLSDFDKKKFPYFTKFNPLEEAVQRLKYSNKLNQ